ncbi:MAG: hypothetical protein WC352_08215 [Candidatus Omnitrophota bacterium]|jgi:predicted Zn-dependent protease
MGIPIWKSALFFAAILWVALRLFPTSRELGFYYSEGEGFDSARFYLARQFHRDPLDKSNTVRYLRSLESSGDEKEFENALQRLYRVQQKPLLIHKIAADFYERRENYEEAARHWSAILEISPGQSEVRAKFISFCLLNNAREPLIRLYGAEVRRGKARPNTYYDLGRLYGLDGRAGEARRVYEGLLTRFPGEDRARQRLIEILEYQNDIDAADTLYKERIALSPASAKLIAEYGDFLIRHARLNEAESILRDAALKFPADDRLAMLYLDALLKKGSREESIRFLESLRAQGRLRPGLLRTLAELYSELGQGEKARDMLREYHEQTGGDYRSHHLLGDILSKLGDASGARLEYERALKLLRS